jgi:hypothetical protein
LIEVVLSVSTWKVPYHLETFLMSIIVQVSLAIQRMMAIFFCSWRTVIDRLKQMTK